MVSPPDPLPGLDRNMLRCRLTGSGRNAGIKKPPRQRIDLRFPWRLLYLVTEPEQPLLTLSALAVFLDRPQVDR